MKISRKSCFCMLISLAATAVLSVTLGYRLLQQNQASMPLPLPHAAGSPLSGAEEKADFHFIYRWDLRDCPTGTEILGATEPSAIEQVAGNAVWVIELTAKDGKLTLKADPPQLESVSPFCKINARFCITEKPIVTLRMPNTALHPQRHFILACELTADYGFGLSRQTFYLQEMAVDLADGSADLQQVTIPPALSRLPRHHVLRGAATGLPERFCGTPAEQELLRYLYFLAQVEDSGSAAALLPGLRRRAEQLLSTQANKDAEWPACWGSAADTARELSRRVRPLLRHMQEHNCYNSADLADFVNSPTFSRIFGPPAD